VLTPRCPRRARSSQLVRNAQLKVYKGLPHGMATTHHDVINADLLAFIKA
jgi:non-heme chloroperoxidase